LVCRSDRLWRVFVSGVVALGFVPFTVGLGSVYWGGSTFGSIWVGVLYLFAAGSVLWLGYELLALAGPRFRIRVQALEVRPGARFDLEWHARGLFPGIRSVKFELVGRETARFRDHEGDPASETETFCQQELALITEPRFVRHRKLAVAVPEHAMHTFASPHNEIYWVIQVSADVRLWPDVTEELELTILPREATA
jgi:hypothetical protein